MRAGVFPPGTGIYSVCARRNRDDLESDEHFDPRGALTPPVQHSEDDGAEGTPDHIGETTP